VQPHNAKTAPKLLQKAIKEGKVGVDNSKIKSNKEYRSRIEKEGKDTFAAAAAKEEEGEGGKGKDKKKEADGGDLHHLHHRMEQLDFLLSRAKEYSDFISADINELQNSMAAKAASAMDGNGGMADGKKKGSKRRGLFTESKREKKCGKKNNGKPTNGEVQRRGS
jgi:hypothetical protein